MVANLLVSKGIQPGDKVALSCPNLPYFSIVYFGILKAGAHRRPAQRAAQGPRGRLPPRRLRREGLLLLRGHRPSCRSAQEGYAGFQQADGLRALLRDHRRPRRRVADRGRRDVRPGARRAGRRRSRPSRPTRTTPRSSSTPPAPPASPRAPSCGTATCATTRCSGERSSAPTPENPDTYLCVLPLFHSFGQTVIQNGGFAYGGTVVMLPRFEAGAALELMQERGHHVLRRRPDDVLGAARRAEGGRRLVDVAEARRQPAGRGRRRLGAARSRCTRSSRSKFGVTILEGYGLSETSPVASFSPYGEAPRVGSIGIPIPGVEMKLIEPETGTRSSRSDPDAIGEIAIKGHNIMKGYYDRPGRDRRGDPRRLVPLRRPRPPGRGRLVLHRRPVQGHDHPRRLQRVPARDRGGPDDPPGRLAGRRHRRAAREPRRGDQGGRHPRGRRRRSPRTSWSPGARSRWPATSTRASSSSSEPADDRHRQDPQARASCPR